MATLQIACLIASWPVLGLAATILDNKRRRRAPVDDLVLTAIGTLAGPVMLVCVCLELLWGFIERNAEWKVVNFLNKPLFERKKKERD